MEEELDAVLTAEEKASITKFLEERTPTPAALVIKDKCTTCHDVGRIYAQPQGDWGALVERMVEVHVGASASPDPCSAPYVFALEPNVQTKLQTIRTYQDVLKRPGLAEARILGLRPRFVARFVAQIYGDGWYSLVPIGTHRSRRTARDCRLR